jgi:transposase
MGIRSERRLCEEVHLNLTYRWFCRLGLEGKVPDHSTFSLNRHGRFRESDILHLFKATVQTYIGRGWLVEKVLPAMHACSQRTPTSSTISEADTPKLTYT